MDFITDNASWSRKVRARFIGLEPIYEEVSELYQAKVFDWRSKKLEPFLWEGVRSVFAIARDKNGDVLLVDHPKRGWEICGGHLTKKEVMDCSVEKALYREVLEESGHEVTRPVIAFLNLVHNKIDANNKELNCPYPEHTLMAFFTCEIVKKVSDKLHDDIRQARIFPLMTAFDLVKPRNKAILSYLLKV